LLAWEEPDKSGVMKVVLARQAVQGKPKKKLLDQVRDMRRLKHYSLRTERTYCDWITRFIRFHRMRHPAEMREGEMSEFNPSRTARECLGCDAEPGPLQACFWI
jgi:hypothetical protein